MAISSLICHLFLFEWSSYVTWDVLLLLKTWFFWIFFEKWIFQVWLKAVLSEFFWGRGPQTPARGLPPPGPPVLHPLTLRSLALVGAKLRNFEIFLRWFPPWDFLRAAPVENVQILEKSPASRAFSLNYSHFSSCFKHCNSVFWCFYSYIIIAMSSIHAGIVWLCYLRRIFG